MPLALTPHTVVMQSATKNIDASSRVNAITYVAVSTIKGMLIAQSPTAAWEAYGLQQGKVYLLLLNLTDETGFKIGDRIQWGSRTFEIKLPVKRSDQGLITDHAEIVCEEITP